MRLTIPIFIAGATGLKKEREQLMALSSEITSKYQNNGYDIVVLMDSFETLGDKKEVHNDYIKNKADIVLFILEDKMGNFTEDEYKLAQEVSQSNKSNSPTNHVFIKDYDINHPTPDIMKVDKIMAEYGSFYTRYIDQEDLKHKVKTFIEKYLDKRIKEFKRKTNIFKNIGFITTVLALAIAGYGIYKYLHPEPMLVFAGGGSVANFIHDNPINKDSINVRNYPNSIYVYMASGNAWSILVEYIYKDGERPFYPICLSAGKIPDAYFKSNQRENENLGHIVGIKLGGYDSLVVYIDSLCANAWGYQPGTITTISTEILKNKITDIKENKNVKIFTTSTNSGTLTSYQKALDPVRQEINLDLMLEMKQSNLFFDSSTESYFNLMTKSNNTTYPFIILGSEHYYVKDLEDQHLTKLYVTNGEDIIIKKPIYLYFCVTSKVKDSSDHWIIESQIVNFLKKVIDNNKTKIEQWENISNDEYLIINHPNELVISLND